MQAEGKVLKTLQSGHSYRKNRTVIYGSSKDI
jgi:hypothetical protein